MGKEKHNGNGWQTVRKTARSKSFDPLRSIEQMNELEKIGKETVGNGSVTGPRRGWRIK